MRIWIALLASLALISCDTVGLGPLQKNATEPPAAEVPDTGYVFDDAVPTPAGPDPAAEADKPVAQPEDETEQTTPNAEPEAEPEPEVNTANAAQRMACQRQKGTLTKTQSGFFVCVVQTDQGRKTCDSAKDCKGVCLARSRTCAPFTPLLGCHDVLGANGGFSTVCID